VLQDCPVGDCRSAAHGSGDWSRIEDLSRILAANKGLLEENGSKHECSGDQCFHETVSGSGGLADPAASRCAYSSLGPGKVVHENPDYF
jgi:hypothetical protein